nr:LuxR C-terminal-related transcriptional regulator [Micrococcus luteus]
MPGTPCSPPAWPRTWWRPSPRPPSTPPPARPSPSPRTSASPSARLDVVRELAKGASNAEIAGALFLAEATVKSHIGKVLDKWQVRDRVQILIRAARAGLVDIG